MVKHKDIPRKPAVVQDNKPDAQEMKAGKYFWCACGRTKKGSFCDGSHHQKGIRPMRVVLEEDQKVWWCACKHTKTPPFCDGSHKQFESPDGPDEIAEKNK